MANPYFESTGRRDGIESKFSVAVGVSHHIGCSDRRILCGEQVAERDPLAHGEDLLDANLSAGNRGTLVHHLSEERLGWPEGQLDSFPWRYLSTRRQFLRDQILDAETNFRMKSQYAENRGTGRREFRDIESKSAAGISDLLCKNVAHPCEILRLKNPNPVRDQKDDNVRHGSPFRIHHGSIDRLATGTCGELDVGIIAGDKLSKARCRWLPKNEQLRFAVVSLDRFAIRVGQRVLSTGR